MLFKKNLIVSLCVLASLAFLTSLFFSQATAAPVTVSRQVAVGADDAHEIDNDRAFASTYPLVRMGKSPSVGSRYTGGFRFTNITVPQGATVNSAILQCYSDNANWDDPSVDIYAEDTDNSRDFVANPDVVNRPKTGAFVNWQAINLGIGYHSTPNIGSTVQEVINRSGWTSGNALTILVKGKDDTRDFRCIAAEGGATRKARLDITYQLDSVSPSPSAVVTPTPSPSPSPTDGPRPNVIVIETDDQRWDTIDFMPTVKNRLVGEGITFTNSFVTTSLCCPSRSSFLTGLYVHNHGVWSNNPPGGGVEKFNDSSTVATWIKGAGYTTGFIGKYLNGYGQRVDPFIPPGWSDWHGLLSGYWGRFYDNGVVNNDGGYSTDVISDKAVTFIRNAKEPFFLWLTPYAPHSVSNYPLPPVVAPRHVGTCEDLPSYRPPSFNEADVADKPAFVRNTSLLDPAAIAKLDTFRKDQICSLKAVDEAVAAILDALGTKLDNTVVVFTSDNGFLWGGHRLTAKNRVYEESIRVPLVIRYPKLIPTATVNDKLVLNIDLAPTIAQLAGVAPASLVNGQSLVPLLSNPSADWRSDFLIEHVGGNFAVRNKQYKYVELGTGEKELYDLTVDPYELTSQHNNPAYASIINTLHTRLLELKAE